MSRARACVVGLEMVDDTNGENGQLRSDASFQNEWQCYADDANDAMMNATTRRIARQQWNKRGIFWSIGLGLLQLSSTYKRSRPEILEWEGEEEDERKR